MNRMDPLGFVQRDIDSRAVMSRLADASGLIVLSDEQADALNDTIMQLYDHDWLTIIMPDGPGPVTYRLISAGG
jgi:hypothetical protein